MPVRVREDRADQEARLAIGARTVMAAQARAVGFQCEILLMGIDGEHASHDFGVWIGVAVFDESPGHVPDVAIVIEINRAWITWRNQAML